MSERFIGRLCPVFLLGLICGAVAGVFADSPDSFGVGSRLKALGGAGTAVTGEDISWASSGGQV